MLQEVPESRQLLKDTAPFATWWALPLRDWPCLLYSTDVETAAKGPKILEAALHGAN